MLMRLRHRDHRLSCPLPLRERATPKVPRALMGEGFRCYGEIVTPHPIEFAECLAQPSPSRGEGALTRTVCSVPVRCDGDYS